MAARSPRRLALAAMAIVLAMVFVVVQAGLVACGRTLSIEQDDGDVLGRDDAASDAPSDTLEGGDAPDADLTAYHPLDDATKWEAFDLAGVNAAAKGFRGAAFDGRYVYLVPNDSAASGLVARYDTQATFATSASWSVFDLAGVDSGAKGFIGAAFDGRYVYFVPNATPTSYDGKVTRYDTQASFVANASWSVFDLANLNSAATGYSGAAFDGRYIYFVPYASSLVGRYDTQAPFKENPSWSIFDMATVAAVGTSGFTGAAFDGRYVYFVPRTAPAASGLVARYDTKASFATIASWSLFDIATVNADAKGFAGAAFDGRFIYLVPYDNGGPDGVVGRYDTQAPFAAGSSWSIFDLAGVNPNAAAFVGAAFDGRFVYFVPYGAGGTSGLVTRYDTVAPFATGASWSTFDLAARITGGAKGYYGSAFDGRYVYLVPASGSVVVRFDAKTPPSLPRGSTASFL